MGRLARRELAKSTRNTHPLPRGHRSSHVNQAFVFVRVIYYYLTLYIALFALLLSLLFLPFFHSSLCIPLAMCRTMRHRAHKLFVCILDARAGMTLRPFFMRHLARRSVPSVAPRFSRRGLLRAFTTRRVVRSRF